MKKWNKPKVVTAYKCVTDSGLYICGPEKAVRGWMAEQGPSPRIMKARIQLERKRQTSKRKK